MIKQAFDLKVGASRNQPDPGCKVHPGTFLQIHTQSLNRDEIKSFDDSLQCFYLISGLMLYIQIFFTSYSEDSESERYLESLENDPNLQHRALHNNFNQVGNRSVAYVKNLSTFT